jgi:CubicO group peptidase (beta-lactamase class C family)
MAALGLDGTDTDQGRPGSIRDLLALVGPGSRPHGEAFAYATPVTDTLGWLLERADDRDGADSLATLWAEVGAERDALLTRDPAGTALMGAGLATTTRDLARFGVLVADVIVGRGEPGSALDGAVLDTIRDGGDPGAFQRGGHYAYLDGYSYRDQWWLPGGPSRPLSAWGIHGQVLWIDPDADVVIAYHCGGPLPSEQRRDLEQDALCRAIVDASTRWD